MEEKLRKLKMAKIITLLVALLLIAACLLLLFDVIPVGRSKVQKTVASSTSSTSSTVVINQAPLPAKKNAGPSAEDIKGASDKMQHPKADSYLPEYQEMKVTPQSGNKTYLQYKTEKIQYVSDAIMSLAKDTAVTALAQENGYTLVMVQEGVFGWVQSFELTLIDPE